MKNFMAMAAMALTFTACTPGANNQSAFVSVSVEQFAADIANPQVQLVDVRTPGEHAAGSIPGSMNIDVKSDDFATCASRQLDKERPVAIYCRSGRRSKTAADILVGLGYKVIELDSGYNGWVEAGR